MGSKLLSAGTIYTDGYIIATVELLIYMITQPMLSGMLSSVTFSDDGRFE